ncbi:MAG: MoaD/ThiS family protein [Candidatus Bathyarchaeota archaeon]|nr:MAG: MoaD/ThiS family protein [Candidatus Bathyarchaeota archaeon]
MLHKCAHKINIELLGVLKELAGKNEVSLEFQNSVVVRNIVLDLADSFSAQFKEALIDPELNDPRPNVLILLNKTEIGVLDGLDTEVKNHDRLVFIPVSHGG